MYFAVHVLDGRVGRGTTPAKNSDPAYPICTVLQASLQSATTKPNGIYISYSNENILLIWLAKIKSGFNILSKNLEWSFFAFQAINPPWQQPARPPPPQVVSNISLSTPVQTPHSTSQPPVSYNIQGVQPPGISTSIQQPVGLQQPGHMHMPAPVAPPSHYSSAGGPVPPPWQSNPMTTQNSVVSSAAGGKIFILIMVVIFNGFFIQLIKENPAIMI